MELATSFPFEIFKPHIAQSFKDLAEEHSIPPDFFGSAALFTIAALSGNMYQTELNGSIKNMVYLMLVGQSGVGKSPTYDLVCGNIIAPLNNTLSDNYDAAMAEWEERKEYAKSAKPPVAFTDPEPIRKLRMATGGTMEGFMSHAMTSPAGYGLYYDEGGELLGGPNQYKKENSSIDFWNKMWNGQPFNDVRADKKRERYVPATSISVMIGMQNDRVSNYFTRDTMDSGLPFRFLITTSEILPLQENVDHFNQEKRKPCDEWTSLVRNLFNKGANNYYKDSKPTIIPFTSEARTAYNSISSTLIRASNKLRMSQKAGDSTSLMVKYEGKLYTYFGRFLIIMAILDNYVDPEITTDHIRKALLLYKFYRSQASLLFNSLLDDDLTENERMLLESLPDDEEFTREEIEKACIGLKLSPKFFDTAFRRKFRNGFIKRVSKGIYLKDK